MWLTTSRERAAGSTLRHEIRHVVLNTRFPDRLPLWIEEGLASRSDDEQRQQLSRTTAAGLSRSGWPGIRRVVETRAIHSSDQTTYTAATSLVNYLLTRGDTAKLLEFGELAKKSGWDPALDKCYGIAGLSELETRWHAWADREDATREQARAAPRFQRQSASNGGFRLRLLLRVRKNRRLRLDNHALEVVVASIHRPGLRRFVARQPGHRHACGHDYVKVA